MRKLILWSVLSFLISSGLATSLVAQKAKLRKAEAALATFRYQRAIDIYEKIHRRKPELLRPIIGLAAAYRKLGQLEQAANWYEKALVFPELEPEVHYRYGQLLFQRGDCADAQRAFRTFLERKPYDERRSQLSDVCAYREQLLTRGAQRTTLDHPDFNGPDSDLGPAIYGEGLVFGSVRPGPESKLAFYDIYYTEPLPRAAGALTHFSEISSFSASINGGMHEAIVSFSPDGEEVYFTRNQAGTASDKNPLHLLEIMVSRKDSAGMWSAAEALPFNNRTYSTAHPALSADGRRLFFSSDRPGGFGGKDIYVSERLGRSWSSPINLGPKVNTEGDELFPFFHHSGELYFASDGQLGLGGQDLFRVEDLGDGNWGRAENLGAPINSAADDFALVLNPRGTQGYFTSNRSGGAGDDDIYAFRPRRLSLELQFTNLAGEARATSVAFKVEGQEEILRSDDHGRYLRSIAYDECVYLSLVGEAFLPAQREICASASGLSDTLRVRWAVQPKEALATEGVSSGEGKLLRLLVRDELTDKPLPNTKVLWQTDAQDAIVEELSTDETGLLEKKVLPGTCGSLTLQQTGYFNQVLPTPVCYASITADTLIAYLAPYRLPDGQSYADRAVSASPRTSFATASQLYADANGAIPYLLNVYYDLGRASVRTEAVPELHKLHRLLVDNPDLVIEIGSHTDSQGSKDFNKRLSQRRADAIARWLYGKGIARDRVVARGYGEMRLTNHCADGVRCSERKHQANRRTEFRVLEHELGHSN